MHLLCDAASVSDACDRLLRRLDAATARHLATLLQLAGFARTPSGYQTVARALARDPRFVREGGAVWTLTGRRARAIDR